MNKELIGLKSPVGETHEHHFYWAFSIYRGCVVVCEVIEV